MRVVVVSAWPPWDRGHGGISTLQHYLRELAPRHRIRMLAPGAPALEAPTPPVAADVLPAGIPVRWFGTTRGRGADYAARLVGGLLAGEPAQVPWVERAGLVAALRAEVSAGTDLVYGFGWGTAALWRHCAGMPFVHTADDAWVLGYGNRRLPRFRRISDAGQAALVRRHERRHYPHAAAVTVVAEPDAVALRALAPSARIEVVGVGVDRGAPARPLPDQPVLGLHGDFSARHNIEAATVLVRQVWPAVRRRLPSCTVLLAGRRPSPQVERLAGEGVRLVVDAPDIRRCLDEMSVSVVVLSSGSGLKLKVLESLAAGRPVVASERGIAGIGAGPGVLPVSDAAAAATALVDLLTDPVRLQVTASQARQRALDDFSWSRVAERLERIWDEAAG